MVTSETQKAAERDVYIHNPATDLFDQQPLDRANLPALKVENGRTLRRGRFSMIGLDEGSWWGSVHSKKPFSTKPASTTRLGAPEAGHSSSAEILRSRVHGPFSDGSLLPVGSSVKPLQVWIAAGAEAIARRHGNLLSQSSASDIGPRPGSETQESARRSNGQRPVARVFSTTAGSFGASASVFLAHTVTARDTPARGTRPTSPPSPGSPDLFSALAAQPSSRTRRARCVLAPGAASERNSAMPVSPDHSLFGRRSFPV